MKYRVPPRVAYEVSPHVDHRAADGPNLFLRHVPGGPSLSLTGVGAVIWSVAIEGADDVAQVVSQEVGENVDDIREEVEDYLAVLLAHGLILGLSQDEILP